jgi:Putative viral replication protein.
MTAKSIWWSVTAFGDEIELCEGTLPEFVKEVYGGRETCPETGTLHFQGAIRCFEQVRMSKFKSWLKKAHLEPARSAEALKKYAMKTETAAGDKVVRVNSVPHYLAHEMCLLLAQTSSQTDIGFWPRVNILLVKSPELAGQLMNPSLRNFYEKTEGVWLEKAAIVLQQPTDTCVCGKDECPICEGESPEVLSNVVVYNDAPTPRSPLSPPPRRPTLPSSPESEGTESPHNH